MQAPVNGYAGDSPTERVIAALHARGCRPKRSSGGNWSARCPAHDDRNASLSVRAGDDGRVLLNCHANCESEAVVRALGMSPGDMFLPRPADERPRKHGVSLRELSQAKCLPLEVLEGFGWRDDGGKVAIPYPTRDGKVHRTRLRTAVSAKDGSRWANDGEGQIAYEPDGGVTARTSGELVVVEGESDDVTLLHTGIGALGIPGASAAKLIDRHHLEGVTKVYIVREPDSAGESFATEHVPARLRELGFEGQVIELRMPDGAKDPNALWCRDPDRERFVAKLREAMAKAEQDANPVPAYQTLADYQIKPIARRLDTGFPTLDRAMRGGIPLGSIVMLNGAPGAGKTALGVCLADRWERQGCAVLYYAGDQHAGGIVVRFAQRAGFSRNDLEAEGPQGDAARSAFSEASSGRAICAFDPFEANPSLTVEDAAQALAHLAGDRPQVLVVDSLQVARCALAMDAETPRARVDAVVATLTALARRGVTVVALNEVSRGAYRTGSRQLDASGLSSGKESSSIEYQGDALLVLRSVKGEPDLVDVEVAKNSRFGEGNPDLRLRIDRVRHAFEEVEVADEDADAAKREANVAKVHCDARELLRICLRNPGQGERDLRGNVRAAGLKWGPERLGAAKAVLVRGIDGHQLENRGSERASCWFAVPTDQEAEPC